jgi:hypothetical protein
VVSIDLHCRTIKLNELIAYFKADFEPFAKIFSHLENINEELSSVLNTTAQKYKDKDFYEQFKLRFFLREFGNQLAALQGPVDAAIRGLEKQTAKAFNRTQQFETQDARTAVPSQTYSSNVSEGTSSCTT